MTDFSPLLETTTRTVSTRPRPEGTAKVVTLTRTFATSIGDAWDALTNPDRIPRWFNPISGDLRLGGHYQIEGNASGTIERCEAPRFFAATWESGGQISWIEVSLTALGDDSTRLTLEHLAIPSDHWTQFGPGAVGIGWDLGWLGLILHLEQHGSLSPEEGVAWMMSEDGVRFMARSNDLWIDADIAGGEEPNQARAAGARTIAFYTGEG